MEPDQPPPPPSAASGIVLAAGGSTRMGRPKPLLRVDGASFLRRTITTLLEGGCADVMAVLSPGGEEAEEARAAGARVVLNRRPESQQIASLRLGLGALGPDTAAAVVLPVDHPLVRPQTVAALLDRWRGEEAGAPGALHPIIRPVHDGRPGHPTLFPRPVWPALMAPLPRGARSVVEDGVHATLDLPVEDPGVLADIDTPEAYERWVRSA